MLATVHVLAGAAVGIVSGDPVLGFISGVVSHHVLDMMPHWDPSVFYFPERNHQHNGRDYLIATVDVLLAFGVGYWLFTHTASVDRQNALLWGMIGGFIPDFWHHIPFWKNYTRRWTERWFRMHSVFHATIDPRYVWLGVLSQVLIAALAWWFVKSYI